MPVLATVDVQLSLHKCNIAKAAPEAREGQLPRNRRLTTNKPRSETGSTGLSILGVYSLDSSDSCSSLTKCLNRSLLFVVQVPRRGGR